MRGKKNIGFESRPEQNVGGGNFVRIRNADEI
jgi:hypothetical protein